MRAAVAASTTSPAGIGKSPVWCSPMPKEVDADLVRKHALLDHVADRLRVRVRAVVPIVRQITKRVQPKDERKPLNLHRRRGHGAALSDCVEVAA